MESSIVILLHKIFITLPRYCIYFRYTDDHWWREQTSLVSDYVEDILAWLKDKESSMMKLELLSPQLDQRRQLVAWTCSMAVQLKLTTQTVHLGVKLLDHFMAGHDIEVRLFIGSSSYLYIVGSSAVLGVSGVSPVGCQGK